MGWSIGYDSNWHRDIGYGVPATCDHPGCGEKIDRGLGCVCGGEPYGGDHGCGLFFCEKHLRFGSDRRPVDLCSRCRTGKPPHKPTPDVPRWLRHKATHPSWGEWRREQLRDLAYMREDFDWYSRPRNRKRYWELYVRGKKR